MLQALVQKQLAENMAEEARRLQSQQSADASKMQADAKRLAEMLQKAQAEHQLESAKLAQLYAEQVSASQAQQSEQAAELEKQLQDLRDHQTAEVRKRLAELQAGHGSIQGALFAGRRLKAIHIQGLSDASRDELLAKLPVRVGDTLAEDSMEKVDAAVKQFDEHLGLSMVTVPDGQVEIRITAQ